MKTLGTAVLFALALTGCGKDAPGPAPSGSAPAAKASAAVETYGVPIGIPGDAAKIADAVNPKHEKPYSGPKATLKGKVRIEGDPPPDTNLKFPDKCKDAQATYAKLFRVGLDNGLADAMVAVTGTSAFVPADGPVAKATIHGCAVNRRTVAMTYGQRLEIANIDKLDSYVPYLDGAISRAGMVAVPGGEPVKLYPHEPGHYMIRDTMPSGLVADVFVLKYATHDVTALDGGYEIKNLPPGKVRVDVFLPVIGKSQGQEFELKEGDNTLDFTLKFDAKKDIPGAAPAASGSASAAPAASGSAKAPPVKTPR
jgi:hypothetical protein